MWAGMETVSVNRSHPLCPSQVVLYCILMQPVLASWGECTEFSLCCFCFKKPDPEVGKPHVFLPRSFWSFGKQAAKTRWVLCTHKKTSNHILLLQWGTEIKETFQLVVPFRQLFLSFLRAFPCGVFSLWRIPLEDKELSISSSSQRLKDSVTVVKVVCFSTLIMAQVGGR